MAGPVAVPVDATLAVIQYLSARTELTALVGADHIVTQIPTTPTYPYVVVQLAGGTGQWPAIDAPTVQIDTVGGTKIACNLIARTVRGCIWAIANDTTGAGVLCSGFDEMAPAWIPDMVPVPPLPRYTARYKLLTHP